MMINTGWRNSEYYSDPTAAIAIANVMRETRGLSDRPLRPLRDEEFNERIEKRDPFLRVQDPKQNWDPEREKWENFTTRIIVQAANDYRKASKVRRKTNLPEAQKTMREVEAFFLSDWFMQMTNVDGEKILKRLQKEVGR
jgi:hypothetical protein